MKRYILKKGVNTYEKELKTWLYPMPVFIVAAYDENGLPNAMNAAWGGIYTDNMVGICLAEEHKTTKNILATRAFTVSMGTADRVAECDYVGIVSGNKEPDKFAHAGFHAVKSASMLPSSKNFP